MKHVAIDVLPVEVEDEIARFIDRYSVSPDEHEVRHLIEVGCAAACEDLEAALIDCFALLRPEQVRMVRPDSLASIRVAADHLTAKRGLEEK